MPDSPRPRPRGCRGPRGGTPGCWSGCCSCSRRPCSARYRRGRRRPRPDVCRRRPLVPGQPLSADRLTRVDVQLGARPAATSRPPPVSRPTPTCSARCGPASWSRCRRRRPGRRRGAAADPGRRRRARPRRSWSARVDVYVNPAPRRRRRRPRFAGRARARGGLGLEPAADRRSAGGSQADRAVQVMAPTDRIKDIIGEVDLGARVTLVPVPGSLLGRPVTRGPRRGQPPLGVRAGDLAGVHRRANGGAAVRRPAPTCSPPPRPASAEVALVSADLRALDRPALHELASHGVRAAGVVAPGDDLGERRLRQLGLTSCCAPTWPATRSTTPWPPRDARDASRSWRADVDGAADEQARPRGRGWQPCVERASSPSGDRPAPRPQHASPSTSRPSSPPPRPTLLVDCDTYGSSVAQSLSACSTRRPAWPPRRVRPTRARSTWPRWPASPPR